MDLVTGGAGFIGSHLVEALVERGRAVRVLDNLATGRLAHLAAVMERIDFVEADILDAAAVRDAMRGVEVVFHQAALRSVPRSVQDPIETSLVNVEGTLQVLSAARAAGVGRVVYASSSSVYGRAGVLPLDEEEPPRPVSPYAVSKLAGERYGQVFTHVYGLDTVALRYFNVFGPRQDPTSPYAAVVPRFIQAAVAGRSLEVHGDGLQSRDFTHVQNVVEANCLAAEAPCVAGEVFNIACGERHSLMDIVGWLGRRLRREHVTVRWHRLPARVGDVRHALAAIGKARRLLGYRPAMRFEDGLENTFQAMAPLSLLRA